MKLMVKKIEDGDRDVSRIREGGREIFGDDDGNKFNEQLEESGDRRGRLSELKVGVSLRTDGEQWCQDFKIHRRQYR